MIYGRIMYDRPATGLLGIFHLNEMYVRLVFVCVGVRMRVGVGIGVLACVRFVCAATAARRNDAENSPTSSARRPASWHICARKTVKFPAINGMEYRRSIVSICAHVFPPA